MSEQPNPEQQLEYLKELRKKYEEVLKDAQKSGDYSEAEKLKQELDQRLTALEALFPKQESVTEQVEKGETSYEKAQEIMGEDFFGTEEFKTAFGFEATASEVPPIPYTQSELEKAKEVGEMLVLRVSKDDLGRPMTMERMNKIMQPRMTNTDGKLLYNTSQYQNEYFYTEHSIKTEWKLVAKELLEGSTDKDYIEQTRALRDHLKELGSISEEELNNCSDTELQKIRDFMNINYKEAAKRLSELLVNQNHRRTIPEAFYDFVIRFINRKEIMLESYYDWTNTLSSTGVLFGFGLAGPDGAFVSPRSYEYSGIARGVISVR